MAKAATPKKTEKRFEFPLGETNMLVVTESTVPATGKRGIDIRRWYYDEAKDEWSPTSKGIWLACDSDQPAFVFNALAQFEECLRTPKDEDPEVKVVKANGRGAKK